MPHQSLLSWKYHEYKELSSTNDFALNYADVADERHIFIAQTQSNGRGRRGHHWISPIGNLYFSQLFFTSCPPNKLVYVSALSVVQTLLEKLPQLQGQISIKWPNDIMLDGKKLGGILIEKNASDNTVIGIGLNLVSAPPADLVSYPATSLADIGLALAGMDFLHSYINFFDRNLQCDFAVIRREFMNFAWQLNSDITISLGNKNVSGCFIGIDEQGFLLLQQDQVILTINTGEILFS